MKSFIFFTVFILSCSVLLAQEEIPVDSTAALPVVDTSGVTLLLDSKKEKKSLRGFFKKDYPHPKKAMIMSFIVPGSGQIYNKKYWKAPIAIGATTAMIFIIRDNTRTYRLLRDEYIARLDDDPDTVPLEGLQNWEDEDIRQERDRWNKWKEMSYIGIVLVQALGGVDAFVDAHMHGYEVSEDLTMKIKPSLQASPVAGAVLGIGVNFQFNAPSPEQPKVFFSEAAY